MGEVVAIINPVEKLVLEIRGHVHDAGRAETTCAKHQLQAGLKLIQLRGEIERDGGDWWKFFEEKFTGYVKSRSYAEKLIRWAKSDDPEAAIEAEKARVREAVQARRAIENHVPESCALRNADEENQSVAWDLVGKALRIVAKMSMGEREQFDAVYRERYQ